MGCADGDAKRARYTLACKLILKESEKKEKLVWIGKKKDTMGAWIVWISTFLNMDKDSLVSQETFIYEFFIVDFHTSKFILHL